MKAFLGVLAIASVGLVVGCGGDSEPSGPPSLSGDPTAENVKACLDQVAPKPMELDTKDPSAPRVLGNISAGGTLSSFVQISVYDNSKDPARQSKYQNDLLGTDFSISEVAAAPNILLNHQTDISKKDLKLLNDCTTPES